MYQSLQQYLDESAEEWQQEVTPRHIPVSEWPNTDWEETKFRPYQNLDWLREMFWEEKLSPMGILDRSREITGINTRHDTILDYMRRAELPYRARKITIFADKDLFLNIPSDMARSVSSTGICGACEYDQQGRFMSFLREKFKKGFFPGTALICQAEDYVLVYCHYYFEYENGSKTSDYEKFYWYRFITRSEKERAKAERWKEYQEYLASDWWKERSFAYRSKIDHCEMCGRLVPLYVHHNNYRNLGCERDEDLLAVCEGCHRIITERMREMRKRRTHDRPHGYPEGSRGPRA